MSTLVCAMAHNRVIGRDGDLPWKLPADMRRFKKLTSGHTVVMGRKTWESLDGALPNRRNIVLSRAGFQAAGAEVYGSFEAVQEALPDENMMVIGGGAIYALALPLANRLCLSVVHTSVTGDVRFPNFKAHTWGVREMTYIPANKRNEYGHTYFDLRKAPALPRPPLPFPSAVSDWL